MAKIATPEDRLFYAAMDFVYKLPESDKAKILTTFNKFSNKATEHKSRQIIKAIKTTYSKLYYEFKKYYKETLLSS